MAKYRVVLFDRSTSTEYERRVEAENTRDAEDRAREEICDFIRELEEITDPHLIDQVREDLEIRDTQEA